MIRKSRKDKDIQKKSYHTDRFYAPKLTPRVPVSASEFRVVQERLEAKIKILDSYVEIGQGVFYVDSADVRTALELLKEMKYDILSEMSAIDNLAINGEFELFYQLTTHEKALKNRRRLRVKCAIKEGQDMPSVQDIYAAANWSERECYDMFGIRFSNHPFLKRILMPTDWIGYPLLKSYPLKGDEFAAWYEVDKIFGKEYRDVIGPEMRDSARVDRDDSLNYARIGKEVPKGSAPQDSITKISYQEDNKPPVLKKFPTDNPTKLEKRI